ncbi:MAG: hypothetical protein ACYDAS_04135 [Patescibacteria group bacterium]
MSSVLLTIKTDQDTKEQIKTFATELGVSSTAFVNMVIRQTLREHRVVLSTALEPTSYLEKVMREAVEDYKNDHNITHTNSPKEALDHLNSLMKK